MFWDQGRAVFNMHLWDETFSVISWSGQWELHRALLYTFDMSPLFFNFSLHLVQWNVPSLSCVFFTLALALAFSLRSCDFSQWKMVFRNQLWMLGIILLPGNHCFQFLTTDRNRNFVCVCVCVCVYTCIPVMVFNLHDCIYICWKSWGVCTVISNSMQTPQSLL